MNTKNEILCLHNILSSTITVVGLGISNLPLLRFLLENGAKSITARDKKEKSALFYNEGKASCCKE